MSIGIQASAGLHQRARSFGCMSLICGYCGRDEANDDVKSTLLAAIGSWLKLANNLPPAVSSRLAACLKEKDTLKAAALTATLQVSFCSCSMVIICCRSRQQCVLAVYSAVKSRLQTRGLWQPSSSKLCLTLTAIWCTNTFVTCGTLPHHVCTSSSKAVCSLLPAVAPHTYMYASSQGVLMGSRMCDEVQALQGNGRIRSQAGTLATPLAKLVEDGASKLAQRATGISALTACCHIAAASHDADEALKQNKVCCLH